MVVVLPKIRYRRGPSYDEELAPRLTQRKPGAVSALALSRLACASLGKLGKSLNVTHDDLAAPDGDEARPLPGA